MVKIKQTKADYLLQLQDCCDSLTISCKAFDDGYFSEAKRIATTLRVLLHDTRNSHSLLGLLKSRTNMRYASTSSPRIPGNKFYGHHALVGIHYSERYESVSFYAPQHNAPKKWFKFSDWWNEKILTTDHEKYEFNRRHLILYLANKDGGAHVDPELPEEYANVSRISGMGYYYNQSNESRKEVYRYYSKTDETQPPTMGNEPVLGVELHTIRQIAYETLVSVQKKFPEVLIDFEKLETQK